MHNSVHTAKDLGHTKGVLEISSMAISIMLWHFTTKWITEAVAQCNLTPNVIYEDESVYLSHC